MQSMTLAFSDPDKRICVLKNACDRFYAGLVTQIAEEQLDLPMGEQDHQPLAFLSGKFKGAQQRWIVPVLCRPDQFIRSSYVDDISCFLVSSLLSLFYTMTSHRDIYIYKC
jgi:RNase H-like domain found in reverse transcriptase